MKRLPLLFFIAVAPIAVSEDLKRDSSLYYECDENLLICPDLKKGDLLTNILAGDAIMYCDKEMLILPSYVRAFGNIKKSVSKDLISTNDTYQYARYSCIYNGKLIKRSGGLSKYSAEK